MGSLKLGFTLQATSAYSQKFCIPCLLIKLDLRHLNKVSGFRMPKVCSVFTIKLLQDRDATTGIPER